MTHEIDLQKTVLDAHAAIGGWGKKMSNMYVSGIPDLILTQSPKMVSTFKIPAFHSTILVEIKQLDALPIMAESLVKFKHGLTELQAQTLLRINEAGGCACWWVVFRKNMLDHIYVGHSKADIPTKQEFLTKCVKRQVGPHGLPWPQVIPTLLAWSMNRRKP